MTKWPTFIRLMMTAGIVWAGMLDQLSAESPSKPPAVASESARRAAAVTLNYSRASFHRIRRNPSLRVLTEEQEKILNHLNLNGVADEDVLKLYSSVLDEIAQIQLADRERELVRGKHSRQFQSQLGFSALALTTQVATAQYASAVRTGASSWWDFRNFSTNRDLDLHRIDKERMTKLVEKSAKFLDVSWKMARDKQIPDRWLVRGDDLDKLEEAWQEPDPTTRLRVLKRMEPFLECYPPYWYYVARTEQALGQLATSAQTYARMATFGRGHFRKDEMLAAGLANRAIIQAYLYDADAPETAKEALACSTEVWEANLICAAVLQRSRCFDDAEDAILRNLDVELETAQSRIALVTLYCEANDRTKLAARLSDIEIVKELPARLLAQCAEQLGETNSPPLLAQVLERSLQASPRYNLGRDDLVIQATSNWQLERAKIRLTWGDGAFVNPRLATQNDATIATFEGIGEFSALGGRSESRELTLTLDYPDSAPLKLTLHISGSDPSVMENATSALLAGRRYPVYRVARYEQDNLKLSLQAGTVRNLGNTEVPVIARPEPRADVSQARPVGVTSFKPALDDDPYFITPEIEIPAGGALQ
ncbi:MAG: hypothetical protein B7Z55_07725 [Planctomycetales bacterium 12-60-4]|nr:MAG: hypothetical protein B7Z55_07725 [Planctomycetales bacterium 12-60-4]